MRYSDSEIMLFHNVIHQNIFIYVKSVIKFKTNIRQVKTPLNGITKFANMDGQGYEQASKIITIDLQ